jgi:hypothetical protein
MWLIDPSPHLFKKTADGWVEYDLDFEKRDDETFRYTSRETRLVQAFEALERLDYLHAVLVPLLPHPLLVSIRRSGAMFLSHIFRIARKIIPRKQPNPPPKRWELVHEIVKNLGKGWQVKFSHLEESVGAFRGEASGPGSMELFFIAQTKKVKPWFERNCPPRGWLGVDGRLRFGDDTFDAAENGESSIMDTKVSIVLPGSMTADEMANEIIARLLPLYADVLSVAEKHSLEFRRKS